MKFLSKLLIIALICAIAAMAYEETIAVITSHTNSPSPGLRLIATIIAIVVLCIVFFTLFKTAISFSLLDDDDYDPPKDDYSSRINLSKLDTRKGREVE